MRPEAVDVVLLFYVNDFFRGSDCIDWNVVVTAISEDDKSSVDPVQEQGEGEVAIGQNAFLAIMRRQFIQMWSVGDAWSAPRAPEVENYDFPSESIPIHFRGLGALEHKFKAERWCIVSALQRV